MEISVVMATLNSSQHLKQALSSIFTQSLQPAEVIVVDGGSTDDTREILSRFPQVVVSEQAGTGLAQAWNQAIATAAGAHIAWLDSDDYWVPDALSQHGRALIERPFATASVGRVRFFAEGDGLPPGFRAELLNGDHHAIMPGTTVVRREAVRELGEFDCELEVATDIDWFARLRENFSTTQVSQVVLNKRVHDSNLSYTSSSASNYGALIARIAHAQLLRRRGAAT